MYMYNQTPGLQGVCRSAALLQRIAAFEAATRRGGNRPRRRSARI